MSYQALYRVWRPQRFDEIQGQETITRTLKNAIAHNQTAHAYLFTGPRGTGKTSAAKIFAKAINCPNQVDGEPCNDCEVCQSITEGSCGDVIEIDAASNNGVDEIRDIREKAQYAPTSVAYKVYIIDEVHMLSSGAFNALLKTLEEPPENVYFILATTEPHKIPLTIISRTQRFDFKRIQYQSINDHLIYILNKEGRDYEEEAVNVIAQAAEGGMRDALSLLDQTMSFVEGKIALEDALQITGGLTQEKLQDYLKALAEQNTEGALSLLQEVLLEGKDAGRFVEDVILICRDILVHQEAPGNQDILKRAKLTAEFSKLADQIDSELIYQIISSFNQVQKDMRLSNHAEVYLEVATVELSQNKFVAPSSHQEANKQDQEIQKLQAQIQDLTNQIKKLDQQRGPVARKPKPIPARNSGPEFKLNRPGIEEILKSATREDLQQFKQVWPDLLASLSVTEAALMRSSEPVAASPQGVLIQFEFPILAQKAQADKALQETVIDYLEKVTQKTYTMQFITSDIWPKFRQDFISKFRSQPKEKTNVELLNEEKSEEEAKKEDNAIVDEAIQLFGEEIVIVKDD